MSFKKSTVEFSKTHVLPKITEDYLGQLDTDNFNPSNRKSPTLVSRSLLVEILKDQNINASTETAKNIKLLEDEKTFTVTTGHQLNIFTGPLYFIYKIITAIKLSQLLNAKYPGYNFVPIYWMNGEDHDLEEINHTYLFGKRVEWKTEQKGATGRMSCAGMTAVIDEVENIIGQSEATALLKLLREAYSETNTLGRATRIFANGLFQKYGLVIIDGDDARLKRHFIPFMKDDLLNHIPQRHVIEEIMSWDGQYEVQVNPREINLFYSDAIRERIVKDGASFKALNTDVKWTEKELVNELETHPERFSPNVVLRPLYQECILPNVAVVGGPAEIAYWLEYKKMFEHYRIHYPTPVLRNCFLIVDEASVSKLSKLGFKEERLLSTADELIKEFILRNSEDYSRTEEVQQITKAFDSLIAKIVSVDASLKGAAEAEKQRQLNALKTLEEKVMRAQKKKHETGIQQIEKLKEKFFPNGALQERHDNFIPYYIKYGEAFFDELINNANPPEKKFVMLIEEK